MEKVLVHTPDAELFLRSFFFEPNVISALSFEPNVLRPIYLVSVFVNFVRCFCATVRDFIFCAHVFWFHPFVIFFLCEFLLLLSRAFVVFIYFFRLFPALLFYHSLSIAAKYILVKEEVCEKIIKICLISCHY